MGLATIDHAAPCTGKPQVAARPCDADEVLNTPSRPLLRGLLQDPPARFPNELSQGSLSVGRLAPRPWLWLLVLWLLCLVPRAGMTRAWPFLWSDSVTYLKASEALERGDFHAAFEPLGLNVFPAILLALRATGVDWAVAGTWWCTLIASLVVLPLFGLVRRQFNDAVAVVACFLYAIHPTLLGFSPLILRDSTFWFLFTLTLYLYWRALTEARRPFFVFAGISLALAVYTRTEGWLLLVPLGLWWLGRLPSAAGSWRRLLLGAATTLAIVPLLVIFVNVTLLRHHDHWEVGYNQRVAHAVKLVSRLAGLPQDTPGAPQPVRPVASPPAVSADFRGLPQASAADLVGKVGSRAVKAFTYAYGILLLIGLARGWRTFFRRDQQAIFLMNLLLLTAIGLRNSLDGIDIRYFLPIVITACPYMALGILKLVNWSAHLGQQYLHLGAGSRPALAGALAIVLIVGGAPDTMPRSYPSMREEAELGQWILQHLGPQRKVAVSYNWSSLLEYYAQTIIIMPGDLREYSAESLLPLMEGPASQRPDVVLLRQHGDGWLNYRAILQRQEELGYRCVPRGQLPPSCRQTIVLVRNDAADRPASTARAQSKSPASHSALH